MSPVGLVTLVIVVVSILIPVAVQLTPARRRHRQLVRRYKKARPWPRMPTILPNDPVASSYSGIEIRRSPLVPDGEVWIMQPDGKGMTIVAGAKVVDSLTEKWSHHDAG